MRSKVIFFSSLIIILIALYIYSFIEDIKSYDSFSFLLAKGFLKTIPLALIIAKWLKEFKENNWVFSEPFQEYPLLPQLPPLPHSRHLPSKWVSAFPRFSFHTSHISHLIINILKNILPKIIKKSLKNFGGFKICYTFALCKTKTPA